MRTEEVTSNKNMFTDVLVGNIHRYIYIHSMLHSCVLHIIGPGCAALYIVPTTMSANAITLPDTDLPLDSMKYCPYFLGSRVERNMYVYNITCQF